MKHVPNALTIVRILITPVVIALLFVGTTAALAWALALFVAASISDWLDGRLARKLGVGSELGRFLDPLADKILVVGTFVALALVRPEVVPWWAVLVIGARDVAVTILRSWAVSRGGGIKTSAAAKTKTTFQLTFLILVLVLLVAVQLPATIAEPARWLLASWLLQALLIATVAVTVVTGAAYFARPRNGN